VITLVDDQRAGRARALIRRNRAQAIPPDQRAGGIRREATSLLLVAPVVIGADHFGAVSW